MGFKVDPTGGAGELFVAEAEDVGILVDGGVGDVHEIIALVRVMVPTRH